MDHDKVNILVVDDRKDKLLALEASISDLGNVIKAQSGKEALRCLMNQEFAVILLDVNMPGMDGFETAAMIRQRESSEHTPIIFVTSFYNDNDTHMARGYSLGAVDYILAPIIPEVLRAKVSVFVDLFRKTEMVKRQAEERIQLAREQAARAAAEKAEQRALFLAEASRLLASSLDYAMTLDQVARMAVPQIGDCCVVDVVNEKGVIERLSVVHVHPSKAAVVRELSGKHSENSNAPFSLPKALSESRQVLVSEASATFLNTVTRDQEHLKTIQDLGLKSYITVALEARERHLGSITLAITESDRRYDLTDLLLVKNVANRAAIAIDNALLYRETRNAVTRLKLLSTELEEANRAKDEFLAVMSHELRTPLTPIFGWVRMLTRSITDPSIVARGLKIIERNAHAQAKLVDDLLDVSRIITGKLKLVIQPMNLVELIEASIETVRAAADAKDIKIDAVLDDDASSMAGDPDRLQQVVWNLLTNSIKFTPKGGTISVRLKRIESNVQIRIIDTGRGIKKEFMPFLFERFRQADSSSTRAYGGLGLGLAIVRYLVELHGGTVMAESEGEGKGATFIVSIPATANASEAKIAPRQKPHITDGRMMLKGVRVLLVEDEIDSREMLAMALQQQGAAVTTAQCAHEALDYLDKSPPDVLVSDIAMPNEDGYAFIRKVRARTPAQGGNVPAIALTAYAKDEDRARTLAEGFQVHVVKPVDPVSLVELIANISRQHQVA